MNCSISRKNLPIYETQSGFLVTFAATPSPDFPTYGSKGVQCKLSRNIKKMLYCVRLCIVLKPLVERLFFNISNMSY